MANHLVSPSMLSANFGQLDRDIEMINSSEADWFHLDVMDGLFVPNISFGMPVINHIATKSTKPLDVHLMIVEPERYIAKFKEVGANILTVHYEAVRHLHRCVQEIKMLGMQAGVSLNPHSPVHLLADIIADLDLVLIMSVNPGFGGQKFIPHTLKKISQLKELIAQSDSEALIEVDGGVDKQSAPLLLEAGADVLVAGSYIFGSGDPIETIRQLKSL